MCEACMIGAVSCRKAAFLRLYFTGEQSEAVPKHRSRDARDSARVTRADGLPKVPRRVAHLRS